MHIVMARNKLNLLVVCYQFIHLQIDGQKKPKRSELSIKVLIFTVKRLTIRQGAALSMYTFGLSVSTGQMQFEQNSKAIFNPLSRGQTTTVHGVLLPQLFPSFDQYQRFQRVYKKPLRSEDYAKNFLQPKRLMLLTNDVVDQMFPVITKSI